MKVYSERFTREEFILAADIRSVLHLTRNSRNGNYQPYHINKEDSLYRLGCSVLIGNEEASVSLNMRTLKLDFAIQVWEVAQKLTEKRYHDYLRHEWVRGADPIKELMLTGTQRLEGEAYFQQMLMEACRDEKLMASEGAVFKGREDTFSIYYGSVDVSVNEEELTDDVTHKIHYQFWKNEKHYPLDRKNVRFTYEDVKDYFVYMDPRMLSLLNSDDGLKEIAPADKELIDSAEHMDMEGMLRAIGNGADINAIDDQGETAITKVISASKYDFVPLDDKGAYEKFKQENPEFTNEEKIEVVKKLLTIGADINFFGYQGLNGLMATSYDHNPMLMKFLLDNGANPNFNHYPDEPPYCTSSALDNVLGDFHCDGDTETLEEMKALLLNAGAKY